MKRRYLEPEAEMVRFYEEDVIRTSGPESGEHQGEVGDDFEG